ncbi:HpcH/HpaI aldolase/citrate lyase family protein [Hyphobacterium marinum]|uniref:CoA ester lyase n=1 Tax=Hyphobacterium marinum TaxID=3116574 RepID=A0ABU7LVR3_9PROT|nr:CoA ester lyase [Hyphobacterium sp. Y6023]MEE2565576.1 CoA ester lyase [Hyphobacterium sp. Y6023]
MTATEAIPVPPRSALFVPATRARAIEKAAGLGADMLILDLEDATGPDDKAEARASVTAALDMWAGCGATLSVRINAPDTDHWHEDLAAAQSADAIVVPKIMDAGDLMTVRTALPDGPPLWAMIETPAALLALRDIAEAASGTGMTGLIAGTNDLTKSLMITSGGDRFGLIPHLANIVAAGRAAGIAILDGVFNAYTDADGFDREASEGRALGFDGKSLIHPSQVGPANAAFAPGEAEIDWAKRVVAAFDGVNADKGVIAMDGEMIERLHLARARAILSRQISGESS